MIYQHPALIHISLGVMEQTLKMPQTLRQFFESLYALFTLWLGTYSTVNCIPDHYLSKLLSFSESSERSSSPTWFVMKLWAHPFLNLVIGPAGSWDFCSSRILWLLLINSGGTWGCLVLFFCNLTISGSDVVVSGTSFSGPSGLCSLCCSGANSGCKVIGLLCSSLNNSLWSSLDSIDAKDGSLAVSKSTFLSIVTFWESGQYIQCPSL